MSVTAAKLKKTTEDCKQEADQQANQMDTRNTVLVTLPKAVLFQIRSFINDFPTEDAIKCIMNLMENFSEEKLAICQAILYYAVQEGYFEVVKFIFKYDEALNDIINKPIVIMSVDTLSPAKTAHSSIDKLKSTKQTEIRNWITSYKIWDPNKKKSKNARLNTLLGMAACNAATLSYEGYPRPHCLAMVKFLIAEKHANVNVRSTDGFTPIEEIYFELQYVARYNQPQSNPFIIQTAFTVVQFLIDNGANWNSFHNLQLQYDDATYQILNDSIRKNGRRCWLK